MILEICHCGHDKATHHEGKHACLGLRCDCSRYVDRWDAQPKTKPQARTPSVDEGWDLPGEKPHPGICGCDACLDWWLEHGI